MNDTLAVKGLLIASITNTQLDASAKNFPRVASNQSEYRRRSTHIHSLSPTDIVVSHVPRSGKNTVQRSRLAVEQTLTRFDAVPNPISAVKFSTALTIAIPEGVTQAEFVEAFRLLIGTLTESSSAVAVALYNGEY
jgi:hypothetical protein